MIVNVISLVIQNIISKNQSLKGCPKKINEREREKKKKRKSSCACLLHPKSRNQGKGIMKIMKREFIKEKD